VDPDAPEGVEPETTRCTRLMRVGSLAAVPEVVRAMPGRFNVTYTYLYLADDDAIVMIDAGFTHWVTGASGGTPTVEENLALRDTLDAAIDALSPGHTLADVAAVYFEHGHIDHTMQARWVHEASGRPLDVYLGEGDVALVTSRDAALACTGQLPAAAAPYLPLYLAPDYVLHPVPTARTARSRADWVDGGHGVMLIPAPSHTQGTILVYLESIDVVIASNHLRRGETATDNDCASDVSTCSTGCDVYWMASTAFPPGARVTHVHAEGIGG
jgi:glyoxylase-like metal-dependent hydrolase (beta-lactamase superfamily II)